MPTSNHLLFPAALGKGLTISKPHWAKGHGLDRGLRTSPSWWMFGANLWHWSHFFTYSCASLCIFDHQYPWVRAMWDKDLPLVWLPQIPLCTSSRSSSTASGCMHSKYGPEKKALVQLLVLEQPKPRSLSTYLISFGLTLGKDVFLKEWHNSVHPARTHHNLMNMNHVSPYFSRFTQVFHKAHPR